MMGLVYPWICIQARIDHDPVDEVIHHGGDAVHTAEPVVEAGRILSGHRYILLLPPVGVRTVLVLPQRLFTRWRASPCDVNGRPALLIGCLRTATSVWVVWVIF